MDVDLTFDHLPGQTRDFEGSQLRVRSDAIDSAVDEYSYQFNINVSIAITEEETDEVQNEFTYSIKEMSSLFFPACIAKKYIFYVDQIVHALRKSVQSKGCLTRHINSKHNEAGDSVTVKANQIPLCEGTIVSIVESIKSDLLEKDYYGKEIQNGLKTLLAEKLFVERKTWTNC